MSLKSTILALLCLGLFGCATPTTPQQLQTLLEQNPEVLTNAIEANPLLFMEALQRTQKKASIEYAAREEQLAQQQRAAEYTNPRQPVIAPGRAILGNPEAPITIVTYSDFQCPYCVRGADTLHQLRAAYCGQLRIVFKHLPLSFHPHAETAARYFEAIARQGSEPAYTFHDLIFANQAQLNEKGEAFLIKTAAQAGADMKRLKTDLDDPSLNAVVDADQEEAAAFGFNGTPAFLVNGISIVGAQPVEEFIKIIDRVSGGTIKPGSMPSSAGAAGSGEDESCVQ
jgi:protein-disulfide isomerase